MRCKEDSGVTEHNRSGLIWVHPRSVRTLLFNATYTEPVTWDTIGYAEPTIGSMGERERGGA